MTGLKIKNQVGWRPGGMLRTFRNTDLEALYQLDQICFAPHVAYSRQELAGYIRHRGASTWVAEERRGSAAELAGFVIAHCGRSKQGHIVTLDVAPAWRRRGVATALMEAAENWIASEGGESVSLEAAEDNLPAQLFYARRGYAKLRRIEGYYGGGEAAWLMTKEFGSRR